jgi:hypothetical protein
MIIFADMKYRGIEYSVVQGLGRQVWKWSVSLGENASLKGLTAIKSEAVGEAERAIDRARADVPRRGLRARPPCRRRARGRCNRKAITTGRCRRSAAMKK